MMASINHGSLQNLIGGGSIHSAQTDIMMANYTSGMQLHGRMSAARRFFCLFITFDLLFTCLLWIICILVDNKNKDLIDALKEQILCYTFKSSIFDIVICSLCRFIMLILFYGIIHIDHWWLVAISTALSCAFLISKTLIYKWVNDTSYPFEVMLVLISFFIAWTEAWLIDFRVLPQEARAKSILEVAATDERSDVPRLERVRDYLSQYTESVANFYSPLQSPADSEEEQGYYRPPKRLSPQEAEYVIYGEEAMRHSWEMVNAPGWNLEKTISHTDVIFSKKGLRGYKIYKLMAIVDASPEALFNECIFNFEAIPVWNKSITKCKVIQVINSKTDITYQIAAESPGGVVTQRDFVNVRSWAKIINGWVVSSMSVKHSDVPVFKNMVRAENGPSCLLFGVVEDHPNRCAFQWLLDVDLKGWIPKYVLEQALTHAVTDFLTAIKSNAPILTNKLRTDGSSSSSAVATESATSCDSTTQCNNSYGYKNTSASPGTE